MSRILTASALALSLLAGLATAASAQSIMAPAGIPAVTAPGGLEGAAAASNLRSYEGRWNQGRPGGASDVGTTGSTGGARAVHGRMAR